MTENTPTVCPTCGSDDPTQDLVGVPKHGKSAATSGYVEAIPHERSSEGWMPWVGPPCPDPFHDTRPTDVEEAYNRGDLMRDLNIMGATSNLYAEHDDARERIEAAFATLTNHLNPPVDEVVEEARSCDTCARANPAACGHACVPGESDAWESGADALSVYIDKWAKRGLSMGDAENTLSLAARIVPQLRTTLSTMKQKNTDLRAEIEQERRVSVFLASHSVDCHWERSFDDPRGRVLFPVERLDDVSAEILEAARLATNGGDGE